jgi:hypothetical protein
MLTQPARGGIGRHHRLLDQGLPAYQRAAHYTRGLLGRLPCGIRHHRAN